MISVQNLKETVNESYFVMLSKMLESDYSRHEIMSIASEQMMRFLNASHAAVYYYDEINNKYQLTNHEFPHFRKTIPIKTHFIGKDILREEMSVTNFKTFQYTTIDHEIFLFVFGFSTSMIPTEEVFALIEKSTTDFLTMINQFRVKERNTTHYHELYELSKRIFTTNDITAILTEISSSLKRNYSEISYTFLLSQDVEVSSTLPVKSIEYNISASEKLSTKAFLTGELQAESIPDNDVSYIYAPLSGKQGIYGVLEIRTSIINQIPKTEEKFIIEFANLTGKAIEAAKLFQSSKHQVTDLTIINATSHQLNSNLDLPEIINLLKEQILSTCNAAEIGFIQFFDNKTKVLSGSSAFFHSDESSLFMDYLHEETKSYREALFTGNFSDGISPFPYRSVMAFPMIQAGNIIGLVVIVHKESYHFSFDQYKLIQAIIQHSTLAMANTILKYKLEQAVITDYLTELYSRNFLEETIQRHMLEGDRGVLILSDIDDFKNINDTYGHHVGDQVLIQVANILKSNIGTGNIAARWGGEEMAIYAPNMTLEEGYTLAKAVCMQVERMTDPTVTLSTGISAWSESCDRNMLKLFMRTDKALYEAKSNGKNQVIKN
ncbi:sensor domain-containing diguanylate cyclase [Oceanobacillus saliphilus]|uniref:sensor domain-containing diguanylate cyclase n=1 Tax=Oceanobacillus saliphilus TaxID=2925834 RepID=UPI00201D4116|nr:sensor domain-containing diguanylate cyclase [Oceanobacillus saliphilus]